MFVIAVAILATLTSIIIQFYMKDREITPALRRTIWGLFIAGVSVLIITVAVLLTR